MGEYCTSRAAVVTSMMTRNIWDLLSPGICLAPMLTQISHVDTHNLPLHRSQFRRMAVRYASLHRQFTSEFAMGGLEEIGSYR